MTDADLDRKSRRWSIWAKASAVIGGLLVILSVYQLWPVRLAPGPKTTVITGPLRPNGTVDYAAALNRECAEGVTPENNAAVLLIQALGPGIIDPAVYWDYFEELGIEPPPLDGANLQSLQQLFVNDRETQRQVSDELDEAMKSPWSDADHPELARWLTVNEEPLKLCAEAARREKYFDPIVPPAGGSMLDGMFPLVQESRNVSRLLSLRAMSHLHSGRIDAALEDTETMHRLSRLIGQHPLMIPQLVATAHAAMACAADGAIVNSGLLTAVQARRQREILSTLPPLPAAAHIIDHGERFATLDTLQTQILGETRWVFLDGNLMLTKMNAAFDEMVAALRLKDVPAQRAAIDEVEERLQQRAKKKLTLDRIISGRRHAVSSQMIDVMAAMLAPAIRQNAVAERRREIRLDLALTGCALAEYRASRGQFPAKLDELVPELIDRVPLDPYTGDPIRYVVDADKGTILLYSVGENGIDDHGRMDGPTKTDDIGFGAIPVE